MVRAPLVVRLARDPGVRLAGLAGTVAVGALMGASIIAPGSPAGGARVATLPVQDVHSAAADPSGAGVLVGHHDGILRSGRDLQDWEPALSGLDVMALAPGPDGAWVVAGHGYIGVLPPAGRWQSRPADLPDLDIHALTGSGRAPERLWLTTANGRVFGTTDAGASWTLTAEGPLALVTWFGADLDAFYAIDPFRGLVASEDGGRTWQLRSRPQATPVNGLATSVDGQVVLLATGDGAFASADGGRTWSPLRDGAVAAVALLPDLSAAVAIDIEGGVYRYPRSGWHASGA